MPVYNNLAASLPYKPFGFPKNWQVEGEKVNTKFLNKWLHIIEEFGTDDFQKIFKLYQRAYFKDSLANENYFKETIKDDCKILELLKEVKYLLTNKKEC